MPWWGWIVIGALLLGAELMVIEAEFFLVFIGVAALIDPARRLTLRQDADLPVPRADVRCVRGQLSPV